MSTTTPEVSGLVYCPSCSSTLSKGAASCAVCGASIRVEIAVARIADPRLAYRVATLIREFDAAVPPLGDVQRALQGQGFKFLTAAAWEPALAFVESLGALGVDAAAMYRAVGGKSGGGRKVFEPSAVVTALLLLIAAAGVAWNVLRDPAEPAQRTLPVDGPVVLVPQGETPVVQRVTPPPGTEAPPLPAEAAAAPAAAPVETPRSFQFDLVRQSLVVVSTARGALGSGFVVAPGKIVTNRHVLQGLYTGSTVELEFTGADGRPAKASGRVADVARRLDLALINCGGDCERLPVLPLGRAADVAIGETVYALGNPLGLSFSLSKGIMSNNARRLDDLLFVQADIAVNPGNSGGPLLNERGEVIGIVTAKAAYAEGIGFALPIEYALQGSRPLLTDVVPTEPDFSPGVLQMMERAGVKPGTENVASAAPDPREAARQLIRVMVAATPPASYPENDYVVRFIVGKQVGEVSAANARYYLVLEHRNGFRGVYPMTDLKPWRYDSPDKTVAVYAFEHRGRLTGAPRIGFGDRVSVRMNDDLMSNAVVVQEVR